MNCLYPFNSGSITHACGQCKACTINRRREWTGRILLEDHFTGIGSSFITLTYADGFQPKEPKGKGTLRIADLDKFMKRLRNENGAFRYFACGEYGEQSTMRPHYHAVLFGIPATPAWLERIQYAWSIDLKKATPGQLAGEHHTFKVAGKWRLLMGWVTMSEVNPDRAAYVASYTTKKLFKPRQFLRTERKNAKNRALLAANQPHHYVETPLDKAHRLLDEKLDGRQPEFARMSLQPGIGANALPWLRDQHCTKAGAEALVRNSDVLPDVRFKGKRYPIGKYLKQRLRDLLGVPQLLTDRIALYGEPERDIDYSQFKGNFLEVLHAKTPIKNAEQTLKQAKIPEAIEKLKEDYRKKSFLRTSHKI